MRAIIALGLRRDPAAAGKLAECALRDSIDIVQSLQIVKSLRMMRPEQARQRALEALCKGHPAAVVRIAAMAALVEPVEK